MSINATMLSLILINANDNSHHFPQGCLHSTLIILSGHEFGATGTPAFCKVQEQRPESPPHPSVPPHPW